ncbi:hypothetical protein LJR225_004516 [Phenylobacterium sp. LjRoot225]|uniref:hypothetical protein n=1 Tax=Phenylobacterium sp. LjRoot225 TaxID=3342285 RepID=UPI003ECCA398
MARNNKPGHDGGRQPPSYRDTHGVAPRVQYPNMIRRRAPGDEVALAFNAVRIQREPELIALAERYGSPS